MPRLMIAPPDHRPRIAAAPDAQGARKGQAVECARARSLPRGAFAYRRLRPLIGAGGAFSNGMIGSVNRRARAAPARVSHDRGHLTGDAGHLAVARRPGGTLAVEAR